MTTTPINTGEAVAQAPSSMDNATLAHQLNKPRFIRVSQVQAIFGIGKTTTYDLISRGLIKSISITQKGCVKGIRLISYDSIEMYLESLMQTQLQEEGA